MRIESTKSTKSFAKKIRNGLAVAFIVFNSLLLFPITSRAEDVVTTIVTQGGDDMSYQVPLTTAVVYDGTTYQNVYATTNSVITFGNPDGTYWTYPQTPSISIESRDWWALPTYNPEMHFIISTSAGGFQVDGAYLPYGTMQGEITNIVITAQIQTDGTVAYSYSITGPTYPDDRTGARLTNGTIVTLEEAGVTQTVEPTVLEPTPVAPEPPVVPVEPTPEPTPVEPVPPTPVDPQPVPNPGVDHNPQPVEPPAPVEPLPPVEETSTPLPDIVDTPVDETLPVSNPEPQPSEQLPLEPDTPSEPPVVEEPSVTQVTLSNGVVLSQEQAQAVTLLQNPTELLNTLFTNPAEAFAALSMVGADMSPEVRERSEEVIVAAVIVGNIATSAAGAAAYRRKP